jgi:transposase
MANPYALELRERAVQAYEDGEGTYTEVAEDFMIHRATLIRWVQRARETGSVEALDRGGGWVSPVDIAVLQRLVGERPDTTTDELTRAYNRCVGAEARVHRSSVLRALKRCGYVFKKNARGRRNKIVRMSEASVGASNVGRRP